MAQQSNWEEDKMLDVFILDYLLKRNLHATARAFAREAKFSADLMEIHAPMGFLLEWWSVFWNIFFTKANKNYSEGAAAYIEAQQMKAQELKQQLQKMQQWLLHPQLQQRDANYPSLSGPINTIISTSSEDYMKPPHSMESVLSPHLPHANRIVSPKSATSYPGQSVQVNPGNVSAAFQQIQTRTQHNTGIKGDVNLGVIRRSVPMDPSLINGQGIMRSIPGLGLNRGVGGLPHKGWPLNMKIDQMQQVSTNQPQDQTAKLQLMQMKMDQMQQVSTNQPQDQTAKLQLMQMKMDQMQQVSTNQPQDQTAKLQLMQMKMDQMRQVSTNQPQDQTAKLQLMQMKTGRMQQVSTNQPQDQMAMLQLMEMKTGRMQYVSAHQPQDLMATLQLLEMKTDQMQQVSANQPQDEMAMLQLMQNDRKRKEPSSPGAASSRNAE